MSITIDKNKCVGCRTCELVCSLNHENMCNPEKSKIRIFFSDNGNLEIENLCKEKCSGKEEALCLILCPTKAIRYHTT